LKLFTYISSHQPPLISSPSFVVFAYIARGCREEKKGEKGLCHVWWIVPYAEFMKRIGPHIRDCYRDLLKDSLFRWYLTLSPIPIECQTIEVVLRSY